jgi:hypothetical protein
MRASGRTNSRRVALRRSSGGGVNHRRHTSRNDTYPGDCQAARGDHDQPRCAVPGRSEDRLRDRCGRRAEQTSRCVALRREQLRRHRNDQRRSPQSEHLCRGRSVRSRDRKGTISIGKDADLLAVAGDPLDNISCIEEVRAVFVKGNTIRLTPPDDPAHTHHFRSV